MRSTGIGAFLLAVLATLAAGPVAAGDPPPPAVAKASSGAVPPTAPPAVRVAPPELNARAWALIDARSGEVLASHAAARHLPVASTTKLMTAYLALKELPLGKIVRAAPYHAIYGESLLGLRPGQRISVRDLLYGLILRSGNDAAYDLANAVAGTERRFVGLMNLRAAALGLSDTHYANPIGLDDPANYSSARDLTTLTQRLLRIPVFARIADSRSARLRSLRPPRRIETLNDLLWREPWTTGVKTGHTFGAAYVLVGAGRRKGTELISAVIGAPTETDRDLESLKLLDYGFSLYRKRVPIRAGEELASPSIAFSGGELPLRAAHTVAVGVRRGERLRVGVRVPGEVEGPIHRGAALGRAVVYVDGLPAASVALLAGRSVPEASTFDRVRSFITGHWILTGLGVFCVILLFAAIWWRRRRRGGEGEETIQANREQRRAERQRRREQEGAVE
ncbi:MAG TPA: D-alanyl-D-alanine carboxypeptidase family protein [Solirubrobacterales bacterium]